MPKYETVAGQVTRAETFDKITFLLKEVEDLCYIMSHLHNTETSPQDLLLADAWRHFGEFHAKMSSLVTQELGQGKVIKLQ